MAEPTTGARQVLAQSRDLWARQPRGRKLLAILVLVAIAAVVAWAELVPHAAAWATVADGISPEDNSELLAALEGRGLPVRLHDGKVEVATERLDEARAIAASAGLPRTGKGFELFDGASLGQSSFAEQVNYRRALQGELARSIAALAQVESARVHLALGKRSVFKDQDENATASVALHLHLGQTLGADQVRGVRELVAASIEGLKPDSVVVVDSHGNLLDSREPGASDKRAEIEHSVAARVRTMLERVVGIGKVSVVASANVEESKVSETQEVFDQEHPALRSESRTIDGSDVGGGIGGIAGARGNLPGAPAPAAIGAGSAAPNTHLQETKNYEVSRTVRQTQKPDSQLLRLHLAVVVDYKTGPDGKPVARTEAELAELTALARQAAGLEDARGDKVEVHSIPFIADPDLVGDAAAAAPAAPALPLIPLAIGGGAVLLVLLALLVRKLRRKPPLALSPALTLALPAPVSELERALDARPSLDLAAGATLPDSKLLPGRTVRDRVLDAVRADLDGTAGVLTAWLAETPRKTGTAS